MHCLIFLVVATCTADESQLVAEQLTHGPRHHFFGYIGHAGTIPFSGDGRRVLTLETTFQDRMPRPAEAAGIGLIDTLHGNRIELVAETRAWNFQQGTMLFWNPAAPNTQFFFNDRDPQTNRVFCVLFDAVARKRLAEYRFDDASIGNGGVAPGGGKFLAVNYGRLARLRPVTGYPDASDWTVGVDQPADDGVFIVDVATREKSLLVSFETLARLLRDAGQDVAGQALFINHTLWNRAGDRIFFFVRASFDQPNRINVPCIIRPDGSGLKIMKTFLGGHPEWDADGYFVGNDGKAMVLYDVDRDKIVKVVGTAQELGEPGGDKAVSPSSRWLVNGSRRGGRNSYTFLNLVDGTRFRSAEFDVRDWTDGELRIDPAPCWNRTSDAIVFPAPADDGTRQMFTVRLPSVEGEHQRSEPSKR